MKSQIAKQHLTRVLQPPYSRNGQEASRQIFDLIELNGDELRREPLEQRKAALERLLARASYGVRFNEHLEADGPDVFHHALYAWP